jgi:hypothetical protein
LLRTGSGAALALALSGCIVAAAPGKVTEPPQEHCPYDGAHANAFEAKCPDEVMGRYLQSVSDFAHNRWEPQRRLSDPNAYVDHYGGKALMAVLGVRVDSGGRIDEVGLHRSSGVEGIDTQALQVFHKGEAIPYPPYCALDEGSVRFRVGLCVEVIKPEEPHWPVFQWADPPAETKNGP